MMPKDLQGANSKTKRHIQIERFLNQFEMLAGLATRNRFSACAMWREQYESFVRPFRCDLANGFL